MAVVNAFIVTWLTTFTLDRVYTFTAKSILIGLRIFTVSVKLVIPGLSVSTISSLRVVIEAAAPASAVSSKANTVPINDPPLGVKVLAIPNPVLPAPRVAVFWPAPRINSSGIRWLKVGIK